MHTGTDRLPGERGDRMRIGESCAKCLYDKQREKVADEKYLAQIRAIIEDRGPEDSSPVMLYRFRKVYRRMFGEPESYAETKRRFNDLALGMEEGLRRRIAASPDPLMTALAFARTGNYIDFGALHDVDEETFLGLFASSCLRPEEMPVYTRFLDACAEGKSFLLAADNCGEIVLDRLFLEQLHLRFPALALTVLVRGEEVLNDATMEDAVYTGLDKAARVVTNGAPVAGTVYEMMPADARRALDEADLILAKGQGNYESLNGTGRHVFYSFLCKCDYFTGRFGVPPLTGMLVEEK